MHRKLLPKLTLLLILLGWLTGCVNNQPAAPTAFPTVTTPPLPVATATPAPTPTPVPLSIEPPEGYFWWNQNVFYEIFVRSFFDSDGDGIGDFNGITEKLDYLNDGDPETTSDLGVKGIWLMPIFPSPSYHGYDVTDYQAVNPDYGTLDDFKRLLDEAHTRGVSIIIDLPLNHTSNEHPWFQGSVDPNSPYRNYYIWSETEPDYLGPWNQDVWHEGPKGDYYYGVFWSGMPDLNYTTPAVVEEMDQTVKFWLNLGVDGFRLDGARYIVEDGKKQADTPDTHAYYKHLRETVKSANPEALLLGEVWTDNFTVSTYTKGDELDLAFNFDFASGIMASAKNGNVEKVKNGLTFTIKLFPQDQSAPFLTNHDMDRVMSELGGDVEKAKNAAAMLLTAPGVPFLYYGEEIGMAGKRGAENTDIKRRLPMQWTAGTNAGFTTGTPWTPLYPFYSATNVEFQTNKPDSLLSFYRDWIHLRNQHPALLFGKTYILGSSDPAIYAILRSGPDEDILALVNLSDKPVTNYTLSLDAGPLKGAYSLKALYGEGQFAEIQSNSKGGLTKYQPVPTLPANGRYLLQLQPAN
jgi:alpha-amylase